MGDTGLVGKLCLLSQRMDHMLAKHGEMERNEQAIGDGAEELMRVLRTVYVSQFYPPVGCAFSDA